MPFLFFKNTILFQFLKKSVILENCLRLEEKKEEILLSSTTKAPTRTEISKGQIDNTNNATKSSITQRLRTDLGWSVWVTTAT